MTKRKQFGLIVACLGILCILGLWSFYFLRHEQRWDSLDTTHMDYPNGWQVTASDQGFGIVSHGPGLTLPCGTYTLEWEIDSDADNQVYLTTDNDANISPANFSIPAGEQHGIQKFSLLETAENLQFQISFENGTYMNIGCISLSGFKCSDRYWILTFFIIAAVIPLYLYAVHILNSRQDFLSLLLLAAFSILAALPAFRNSVSLGHDGAVHITRLEALVSTLLQKQFPARIDGALFHGYGSLFSVYYPSLMLYPAAVMVLFHASVQCAYHFVIILISFLTAFNMYICGRKLFNSRIAGLLASVLYLFSPYRLTNVFTRAALGEAAAMAFLPLFFLFFYECLCREKRYWPHLALSAVLLVNTHLLTALFVGILSFLLVLFFLPKLLREKRFLFICFALVLAFGMSLSLLTPMLTYFHQGIDTSNMSTLMSDNTLSLGNLLGFEAVNPYYWLKHSRSIGLPLILSNICLLPFLFSQHSSGEKHIAVFSLAAGIILCFMTTRLFPWQLLSIHTNGATDIYQFPYRFLGYADVLLAISGSYALSRTALFISSKRPSTSRIFSVCLIILCFVLGLTEAYPIFDKTFHDQKQYKKGDPFFDRFTPPDYILTGTDIDLTDDNTPSAGQGLHISSYRKYGTTTAIDIHAETQTYISLPVFAFDGYSAKLNGKILPIQSGINNRITIPIDASSEGTLLVSFSGKSVWKLADLCSLAFFILTLFFLHKHRNCIPRKI